MMQYGLPNKSTIEIYELGINDRYLCQQIAKLINYKNSTIEIIDELQKNKDELLSLLNTYPTYYKNIIMKVIE